MVVSSRRSFLGLLGIGVAAPMIVPFKSLMAMPRVPVVLSPPVSAPGPTPNFGKLYLMGDYGYEPVGNVESFTFAPRSEVVNYYSPMAGIITRDIPGHIKTASREAVIADFHGHDIKLHDFSMHQFGVSGGTYLATNRVSVQGAAKVGTDDTFGNITLSGERNMVGVGRSIP